MKKHIAVVSGGMSSERDVSIVTGKGIAQALEEQGYRVTEIDMQPDIAVRLTELKPDIVYNALHGTYGEDGCLPGLLEIMGIPYTHSGVLASALAMDKVDAKEVFVANDIPCPSGRLATVDEILEDSLSPRPYVIKPANEGSSVGVFIIHEGTPLPTRQQLEAYDRLMVERYIPGKEISVAVLDDKPLGVIELRPTGDFYDYDSKYVEGLTEHIYPAEIPDDKIESAMELAAKAHTVLGCRGISRSDFRYHVQENMLFLLEVNTHPGMTPLSIAPEIARHAGISYRELVQYIVESAQCQKRRNTENLDG